MMTSYISRSWFDVVFDGPKQLDVNLMTEFVRVWAIVNLVFVWLKDEVGVAMIRR